ncbi:MAG TPA: radical SAM family heme chaperone HemW [Giesbergeria sp.]|jgi:putative oxygen-independent coproporphyrinogen III oxidase|nr:oxygen-independent coproporphyrinogen III oxidase-like protein [Comamonas sp.]MCL4770681.1 oxygen-independent coproporphyrinogen III oxidase-like protein [Burkholderiaceae bacterium]HNQ11063.1 radical SAM family heme chaperone HemW [Giesbergeria sp.]
MSIPIVSAADEAQPAPQRDIQHYMRPGLLQLSSLPPLSLYVHIPWCLRKCPYCDFNSHAHQGGEALPEQRYLDALCADLEAALPLVWGRQVHSVFIGGGTPSLFAPASIDRLLADIRARLPLAAGCEVTLEANPGTFEKDRFRAFRAAGVTRLSIGVQSFNDPHLQALGRVHDRAQAIAAVEEAQQAFETFNLDLMYALPGQTLAELDADLRTALALAPPHLSVYHLTIEPNTWFAKHPPTVPPDDEAYAMLDHITEHTAQAGLERYEVSAYARSSHQCQHNTNYWEFGDYLGIGAGAHSKLSFAHRVVRQVRFRDPQRYMDQALAGQALAQDNEVRRGDLPFEFMLNALRLRSGFALQDFVERTGLALTAIEAPLQEAERKGLILRDLGRVKPTPRGFDFLSDLQELFL